MKRLSRITQAYRAAGAMSDLVPLYGFIDDGVFLTKSGALGMVLALEGVDYECLDPQQREAVTSRFEVALRLWDERTRLYQYVLKRNRVARPDDAHPHPAVDTLLRRRHAHVQAHQADLFTLSLYLVVVVDPDRLATAWAGQARRALRQPLAVSREWLSTTRTIVRLDRDLDQRRVQVRHKVEAFVQQLEDAVAPRVLPKDEALRSSDASSTTRRRRRTPCGCGTTPFSTTTPPIRRSSVIGRTSGSTITTSASSRSRSRRRRRFPCCSRRSTRSPRTWSSRANGSGRPRGDPPGDSREAPAFP